MTDPSPPQPIQPPGENALPPPVESALPNSSPNAADDPLQERPVSGDGMVSRGNPKAAGTAAAGFSAPGLNALLSVDPDTTPDSPAPVRFPISWIFDNASPPMMRRALLEIAEYPASDGGKLSILPYLSRSAWNVQMMQEINGLWGAGMLTVPRGNSLRGVGTIPAFRRLLEFGWDPESPGLAYVRRLFFRLLAEDDDPSLLFELANGAVDEALIRRGRALLREAAAGALAAAGYTSDPRVRGVTTRMLDRIIDYLNSPLVQNPWVKSGSRDVLAAEAYPPSYQQIDLLSNLPSFRHERHGAFERLYEYLARDSSGGPVSQLVGRHTVQQPQLILGNPFPDRRSADADIPSALAWLEMMARLGFLTRNESWSTLFESLIGECDDEGIWRPPKGVTVPRSLPDWSWPSASLSDQKDRMLAFSLDTTFRIGLIARLTKRDIELI